MAGVKGRSGGPRTGAGRKARAPAQLDVVCEDDDPVAFLLAVMRCKTAPAALRVKAAIAALPHAQTRPRAPGKKVIQAEQATAAARGRLAPGDSPKLKVVSNAGLEGA